MNHRGNTLMEKECHHKEQNRAQCTLYAKETMSKSVTPFFLKKKKKKKKKKTEYHQFVVCSIGPVNAKYTI